MSVHIVTLEGEHSEENPEEKPGPMDSVVYNSFAIDIDFELRQLIRGDYVTGAKVNGPDDASNRYMLML
jgi:hypothetical protein